MASRRLFDGAQQELGLLPVVGGVVAAGTKVWLRVAGVWRETIPWIKIAGVWKQATTYIRVNGVWK